MTQSEVLDYLEKNKGVKFSVRDLSRELNISYGAVGANLKKLKGFSVIRWEVTLRKGFVYWKD